MCIYSNHYTTSMYSRFLQKGVNTWVFKCITYYIVSQQVGIIAAAATTKTVAAAAAAARPRQLKSTKENSLYRTLTAPFWGQKWVHLLILPFVATHPFFRGSQVVAVWSAPCLLICGGSCCSCKYSAIDLMLRYKFLSLSVFHIRLRPSTCHFKFILHYRFEFLFWLQFLGLYLVATDQVMFFINIIKYILC